MIENLNVFFNEFAVTATLENSNQIKIIFDKTFDTMMLGSEGKEITATCKTEDLTNVNHKDTITIKETVYTIVGIEPTMDGKITKLVLTE